MSRDRTVGETFYVMFTTRAFATGVPTTLAGTPVVSAYEDNSITQITAGITLGVDHDSVTGLNLLTIVATGANGFEAGKDYHLVITTGTVGGVSVVGEVVGEFSLGLSAAFTRIGAAGAGLTAINLPDQTMNITGDITGNLSGSVGSVTGAVGSVTGAVGSVTGNVGGNVTGSVGSVVGHTPQTGDSYARLGAPAGLSVSADIASVQTDTDDIQTRIPTALVGGRMNSNVGAINNVAVTGTGVLADEWGP